MNQIPSLGDKVQILEMSEKSVLFYKCNKPIDGKKIQKNCNLLSLKSLQ